MSKRKGLTASQRERIKSDLLQRQHWLQQEARGHLATPVGEDTDGSGDEGDLANAVLRTDLAVQVRARESRELHLISTALGRIEEGSYGSCAECEGVIPLPRLQALPFAQNCIDCQEELECEGALQPVHDFRLD